MKTPTNPFAYDRATRWLHLGLALTVTYQLFISLIMDHPRPDRPLTGTAALIFETHEWVGVTAFAIVVAHVIWSFIGPAAVRWTGMIPWRPAQWRVLSNDLREMVRLRLPLREEHDGLAALTHGLGLLAVLAIASSGFIYFLFAPEGGGRPPSFVRTAMGFHEFMSTFVWIYWGGHVGMAVLHRLMGHRVFERIMP